MRVELGIDLAGLLAGVVGYQLDVRILDFIAILCPVAGASFLVARALRDV